MKSNPIFSLLCAVFTLVLLGMGSAFAQLPGIPYQAYIMDKNANFAVGDQLTNIPLSYTKVMLEFTVLNENDTVEYSENISVTTDPYGLLSTTIGVGIGTITYGSFAGIIWDGTKKTLRTRIDFSNLGSNFEDHSEITLYYIPGPSEVQGLSSGTGAPTSVNPADPTAGDIYVDEATGDMYAHDGTDWVKSAGSDSGTGAPTAINPADPDAGDIYVDDATGDIYTYDGSEWISQSDIVSAETDNVITEDTKGLAFLDADAIKAASGTSTGTGAPTAINPADPDAGDLYVDEDTGDIYTYNGSDWVRQPEAKVSVGTNAPTTNDPANPTAGDIYVDEATGDMYAHDGTDWVKSAGSDSGTGAPTAINPADPDAGDIYVDDATGDIYTYDGSEWISQSDIVSAETDNVITEDTKGLAFLDADAIKAASGTSTGTGAPTAINPADPDAGDLYVDEDTGDIYTYNGSDWVRQPEAKVSTGTGAPTAVNPVDPTAGDIYVDEATGDIYTYVDTNGDEAGDTWESQSDGGRVYVVTDASADITLDKTHDILWIDASAADINVNLPSASTVSGRTYTVVKADDSNYNLVFSESITGSAFTFTKTNVPGSYRLQSNGTNWLLLK